MNCVKFGTLPIGTNFLLDEQLWTKKTASTAHNDENEILEITIYTLVQPYVSVSLGRRTISTMICDEQYNEIEVNMTGEVFLDLEEEEYMIIESICQVNKQSKFYIN